MEPRVQLVALEKSFLPAFVKWFNDPEITDFLAWYRPMSLESEEAWFSKIIQDQNEIVLGIRLHENPPVNNTGNLIGNCGVRINWKDRVGNVGIMIGEKSLWGKGYGTEAMRLLVQYCFNTLNMHRVELETYSHNLRARKSYEKIGFKLEGTRRQAVFKAGQYRDVLMMSILEHEFRAAKSE